jgi:hypothetical protein
MRKPLNWPAVAQWQELMAEWEAVSASYESARTRAQDPAIDDTQRATIQATATEALTRLRELKVSIDDLVSKGAAERPVPDGQFTVATIDFDRDMDEADTKAKRLMP